MKRKMRLSFMVPCAISGLLFLMAFFLNTQLAMARYQYEFTPSISVSETYDDNIYLDSFDETSDYITSVSPGLSLRGLSPQGELEIAYTPTFVWYGKEDQNDTVRHLGALSFGQSLTQHLRVDLSNAYIFSEEPIETTEEVTGVRRTLDERFPYQRNTFEGSFRYLFGPENTITAGYRNDLLSNEKYDAPFETLTPDDGTIQTPYGSLAYWFNDRNGVEVSYEYVSANFSQKSGAEAGDDYEGHGTGIDYIYRFTRYSRVFAGYAVTIRDFDGDEEDYSIHEGSAGLEHAFSPNTSIFLRLGYFVVDNEDSDDDTGPTYEASLDKTFSRGTFRVGGTGGYNEAYLEAERRGLTLYWSVFANIEYQFLEDLSGYAGGSYRWDEESDDNEFVTWRGNVGLRWTLLRWLSAALDYTYAERDDDVDFDDYVVNRISLTLSASEFYRR
ncbi:MAG: outer membrane beta-barrel protein [Desulfatiglandaceae bacterium]